jgi:hypothetical protein
MSYLATVYCCDEDVAIRAPGDFRDLIPDGATLAAGSDGAFAPTDRWTLNSPTADFTAQGVRPGHVCQLLRPTASFGDEGELLAVQAVAGPSLTLRRLGQPAGIGQPPAPAAGLGGVRFLVASLDPQIEEASYDLNQRYAIDEAIPDSAPALLARERELRQLCVLTVLARQYQAESREKDDTYARKGTDLEAERQGMLSRVQVHWDRPPGETLPEVASVFGTRVER